MSRLTFMGTGTSTGVPEIGCTCATCLSTDPRDKRWRTSALIEHEGMEFTIDCGPDFREQLLREDVHTLDAIFLTHEHYDHVGGVDDIRPLFRNQQACNIYAEPNVIDALTTRMPYAFALHKYPGVPDIALRAIAPGIEVSLSPTCKVLPLRVMHGRLPIVGYKIGDRLGYVTDCKTLPDETIQALKGINLLVINALRTYEHPAHMDLEEALAMIERIGPKETYLIHVAHTFGTHEHITSLLPDHVHMAYDHLSIDF